jgi:hypothetical protein
MSNLKVATINDASGGSNAVLYGVAAPTNSMGFRNRIINGDMRIDQRNAGASVTLSGSASFAVDRYQIYGRVAGGATAQRSTVAPAGFSNSLLYTVTSGASPSGGDYASIVHKVEGFNIADFGWGTANAQSVTLSFWVRSSVTGTYALGVQNSDSTRSYVAQYTVNAANTWEQKTITIAGDTGGSWLNTNGTGLQVVWDMGFGYGATASPNSWLGGDFRSVSGNVKLVATTGATFYITGVQLEAGSVASPFERRDYGRELMMCQRYWTGNSSSNGYIQSVVNTFSAPIGLPLAVPMRTAPTIAATYKAGGSTSIAFFDITQFGYRYLQNGGSGFTDYWLTFNAEL